MKSCPDCGADNFDPAVRCHHCKRALTPNAPPLPIDQQPRPLIEGPTVARPLRRTRMVRVAVTDIDMPFGSMVTFMVKWAIATIPALIILFVIGLMLGAVFGLVA